MQLDKNSWHVRLYRWWYGKKHGLSDVKYGYADQANLCPYVRVVLLWAPLRWIFLSGNAIKLWFVWLALAGIIETLIVRRFGFPPLFFQGEIAFLSVVIVGIPALANYLKNTYGKRVSAPRPIKSFFTVLGARKQAFHDKICPILTFVEEGQPPK